MCALFIPHIEERYRRPKQQQQLQENWGIFFVSSIGTFVPLSLALLVSFILMRTRNEEKLPVPFSNKRRRRGIKKNLIRSSSDYGRFDCVCDLCVHFSQNDFEIGALVRDIALFCS